MKTFVANGKHMYNFDQVAEELLYILNNEIEVLRLILSNIAREHRYISEHDVNQLYIVLDERLDLLELLEEWSEKIIDHVMDFLAPAPPRLFHGQTLEWLLENVPAEFIDLRSAAEKVTVLLKEIHSQNYVSQQMLLDRASLVIDHLPRKSKEKIDPGLIKIQTNSQKKLKRLTAGLMEQEEGAEEETEEGNEESQK